MDHLVLIRYPCQYDRRRRPTTDIRAFRRLFVSPWGGAPMHRDETVPSHASRHHWGVTTPSPLRHHSVTTRHRSVTALSPLCHRSVTAVTAASRRANDHTAVTDRRRRWRDWYDAAVGVIGPTPPLARLDRRRRWRDWSDAAVGEIGPTPPLARRWMTATAQKR